MSKRVSFFLYLAASLLVFGIEAGTASALEFSFEWANPKPQGNGINGMAFDGLTGYAVGNLGASLKTADGGVSWSMQTRYPEFQKRLRDVIVIGPGELLAAGESPGIFRSLDGGASWSPVTNPSTFTLNHLVAITSLVVSAVGDGQIIRSTDGGATWALGPSPGAVELRDQFWWDVNNGFVVGDHLARRTTDGGNTWQPLPGVSEPFPSVFTDITFHDPANGWLLEHFTTYRTTDGGASWFQRHGQPFNSPIYQEEALVIDPNHRYVITNLEGAQIWETTNDATSWTKLYERRNTAGYTDIERLADGTLVVSSLHGDLVRSTNGGQTWHNFVTSPGEGERATMQVLSFLPGGKAFAGGDNGVWLESSDAGATWGFAAANPGFSTANSITFRGGQLGLVGGYGPAGQSRVARTINGGVTWTLHSLAPNYVGYVQEIAFPDDSIAYAVTQGGDGINYVYRSTDGGVTWGLRNQGVSNGVRLETIFFLDVNTGFVGGGEFGSNAVLWKTTDAGMSWTLMSEVGLSQASIQDMFWSNEATGVVVGYDGACRTTDGGQTWTSVLNVPLLSLDFRDALHGFACSYFDQEVWATENGGVSWERVETPWEGAPSDIKATSGGFAICGGGSVILIAHEQGVTSAPEAGDPLAVGSSLRVWPNPGRGIGGGPLTFGIDRGNAGPVEMRIYDAAGRLVEALTRGAEESINPWTWNPGRESGRPLAAGTYFLAARTVTGQRLSGRLVIIP